MPEVSDDFFHRKARRHKRPDRIRLIVRIICNETALSRTGKIADISCRDLSGKIDDFQDRARAFMAERQDISRSVSAGRDRAWRPPAQPGSSVGPYSGRRGPWPSSISAQHRPARALS